MGGHHEYNIFRAAAELLEYGAQCEGPDAEGPELAAWSSVAQSELECPWR